MEINVLIGIIICIIIVIIGLYVLRKFMSFRSDISSINDDMELAKKKNKGRAVKVGNGYMEGGDVYEFEDNLVFRERYNKIRAEYLAAEQFIPIFPLLGILGTVLGLIPLLAHEEELQKAMSTSMYTTLFGLIAAIILKFVDASLSKSFTKLEMSFDMFDYKYKMVNDKSIQESKEQDNKG